jgi:hypothetical protein
MRTLAICLLAAACGSKAPPTNLEGTPPSGGAGMLHVQVRCQYPNGVAALLTQAEIAEADPKHLIEGIAIGVNDEDDKTKNEKLCSPTGVSFDVKPGTYTLVVGQNADGGGDFHGIKPMIVKSSTTLDVQEKDLVVTEPCISCPYLAVWDGRAFAPRGQVLRDIRSLAAEREERTPVELVVVGKTIRLQLSEQEDEVSHVDALLLDVGGRLLSPDLGALAVVDRSYGELHRGDSVELVYHVDLPDGPVSATVVATGYYVPLSPR